MVTPVPATTAAIGEAARIIRAGGLAAFPTETVYGLGADARQGRAVARIFEAKGRPRFNPLIAHVAGLDEAAAYAAFTAEAERLARGFWPGALTLVLPRRADAALSDLVSAGLPTVALRVPCHEVARALIRAAGAPIAAPSANISGRVSATRAEHVAADFGGRVDMVLDGGPCAAGLESTIVALGGEEPALLRSGAIAAEEIERVLGRKLVRPGGGAIQAPGMMQSHYAPRARLRLGADAPRPGEAFLTFGAQPHDDGPEHDPQKWIPVLRQRSCSDKKIEPRSDAIRTDQALALNLSPSGDLREAAANLFAYLRALDSSGIDTIAVAPVPAEGLGEAINDRLRRAAAPRPE